MDHPGPCPHPSVPVEVDESISPTSFQWASCQRCIMESRASRDPGEHGSAVEVRFKDLSWDPRCDPGRLSRDPWSQPRNYVYDSHCDGRVLGPQEDESVFPHTSGSSNPTPDGQESLDRPFSLISLDLPHPNPSPYAAACSPVLNPHPQHWGFQRRSEFRLPATEHQQDHPHYPEDSRIPHQTPQPYPQPRFLHHNKMPFKNAPHQVKSSTVEVMQERGVGLSMNPQAGPITRETRKTISLPEESRIVFITYSSDTAAEMIPFTKFLSDQGFKPESDMFDSPIRRMGISKWMDRFLNDKSVLILVVVSPGYKQDVEGINVDEHALLTKYIHNQIQNEFIQQGCTNFRLVPVLFPNATKRHVPNWLQNTRIYSWPRDTQDLLLRLLREERYILPQRGGDLTLTVRPL